jgi:V8-like Glu-specific endopeptidase
MAHDPKRKQLPLSSSELRSTKFKISRHEAEAPALPAEPPRRIFQTVKKSSTMGAAPDVLPSMPSYANEISPAPALAKLSPPARVLFRGYELEPLTIMPPDGRRLYNDRTYPWNCVCQVVSGNRRGSGVLIGPRHVLTASHVIDWRDTSDFITLIQGRVTLGTSSSTDVMSFVQIDNVDYNDADDDYAVIVLANRLGDSFGWFGAREYNSDWDNETANWVNIAYAPDLSRSTPAYQTGFFLDEDDFDLGGGRMLITKTGDFVPGMSGSPVFGLWPEGPLVVGVVSAETAGLGNFNAIAGGSNLPRLVNQARADFP